MSDIDDVAWRSPVPPDWTDRYWATSSELERWKLVCEWIEACETEFERLAVERANDAREHIEVQAALAVAIDDFHKFFTHPRRRRRFGPDVASG